MILIRIILIPVSLLYCLAVTLRNKFYDWGLFKSAGVSVPVVSIGNVSTGGTGKTPVTILVSSYYLSKGKRVGIISRGYKRSSNEMTTVFDGKNITAVTSESGDELKLIAEELIDRHKTNFYIIAAADRITAAEFLINEFNPEVIILDDAFQHRKLKRDLNIVLIDSYEYLSSGFLNKFTLPSGSLRESYRSLKRADIIIQNNKNRKQELLKIIIEYGKTNMIMRYRTEYFVDNKNCILDQIGKPAIVFSGVADDRPFLEMVVSAGIKVSETIRFPDHHNYTESDINSLKGRHTREEIYITTEKDYVKVKEFSGFVNDSPVYYLKLGVELVEGAEDFYGQLDKIIK